MRNKRLLTALVVLLLAGLTVTPGKSVQFEPEGNAVVGGACNEAAFNTALNTVQTTGGGTITFNCGAAPFAIVFSSQKTITANVTIDGANLATLSGGNSTRLFYVSPGVTLTLKNLTVSNGNSGAADAGAIFSSGSLVIDNCHFLNNHTGTNNFSGGAILNTGPLTITNSEFAGNTGGNGGALFPRWGNAVTSISKSYFHDNQALNNTSSGWGGAILAWDGVPLTISNSNFINNWTARDGGAIYITANSNLIMTGGSMSGNQANYYGGALVNLGSASITDTVISGNLAVDFGGGVYNNGTLTMNKVWLNGNYTFNSGGAVYNGNVVLSITNSAITNNTSYFGGGIHAAGTVNILNTTLANNKAQYTVAYGGGIYVEGSVSLNFVTLVGNTVNGSSVQGGSSIYRAIGLLTLKNTIISSAANACDGAGAGFSNGFNIATDGSCGLNQVSDKPYTDPQLGLLGYNGGPTLNAVPNLGSLALNNGQCSGIVNDQRGITRPQGAACDMGAVERLGAEFVPWIFLPLVTR
jgi:hypothetical protein